jgi:hypothetical protein
MPDNVTVGQGALRRALEEARRSSGLPLRDLMVLARQNDPFFFDTPAGHRDGLWIKAQLDRLMSSTSLTHWRGVHYVLVAAGDVIKPNGTPYHNTFADYLWLIEDAAKAARWLGYLDLDLIIDKRNDAPVIFRSYDGGDGIPARAYASLGLPLELLSLKPDDAAVGDCLPWPSSPASLAAPQPYLLAFFGEKSSLAPVLRPAAQRYCANMYLCAGEISDTLIRHMAKDAVADPLQRPLVVLTFSDFDPAGMQMPVSISWKLMALKLTEFPSLNFKVAPMALTLEHVLAERLPTTPVKPGDVRRDRWQSAYGPILHGAGLIDDPLTAAQVEIDALAALRPDVLTAIAENAIEGVYYDATLRSRAAGARSQWRTEAQAAIERQIDPTDFDEVRNDAENALERLKEALADLNDCDDRLDELTEDIELPEPPEPPAPDVDEAAQKPLADSDWGLVEMSRTLRARKAYRDGGDEGIDE